MNARRVASRDLLRSFGMLLVGVWLIAAIFFATLGVRVAGSMAASGMTAGMMAEGRLDSMQASLTTLAYSLGYGVLLLGATAVVLPAADRRALAWWGAVWAAATAMLLITERVGGIPLVLAAIVALLVAVDTIRRIGRAWLAGGALP